MMQETETERAEREDLARTMDAARLQGRLEAFSMAMTECGNHHGRRSPISRPRDSAEIRKAIDILHLHTLLEIKALENGS
jgi:hypothetical protein